MVHYTKLFKGAIAIASFGLIILVLSQAIANTKETPPPKKPQAAKTAVPAEPQVATHQSKYTLPPLTPVKCLTYATGSGESSIT